MKDLNSWAAKFLKVNFSSSYYFELHVGKGILLTWIQETVGRDSPLKSSSSSAFERRHSSSHNFINQENVASNNSARENRKRNFICLNLLFFLSIYSALFLVYFKKVHMANFIITFSSHIKSKKSWNMRPHT